MINPTYYPQPNYYQQPVQQASNVLVSVRNQQEAMNYPVAPGNSVIFKDEGAPYIYTKTMGFSQLDKPIFEKYKLVKERGVTSAPFIFLRGFEHVQIYYTYINS